MRRAFARNRKDWCQTADRADFRDIEARRCYSANPVGDHMNNRRSVTSQGMDLGALLEALVQSRQYVPPGARHIRSQDELPLPYGPTPGKSMAESGEPGTTAGTSGS